jgi:hypothetical protein
MKKNTPCFIKLAFLKKFAKGEKTKQIDKDRNLVLDNKRVFIQNKATDIYQLIRIKRGSDNNFKIFAHPIPINNNARLLKLYLMYVFANKK